MVELHVERHGHVSDDEVRSVVDLLEECYSRVQPEDLDFVEVLIFESNALWRGHVSSKLNEANVASTEFGDAFVAAHEAWTGIPRISVSLERKRDLAQEVWEGAIRHEAAHSILHGSLEYYIFPMPRALQKNGQDFPTLQSHLTDILYLLSITVKDIEATKLLISKGYTRDQVAYARFTMKASQQDLDAWSLASIAAEARVLCLMGRLKDIAAGAALATGPLHLQEALKEIEESIVYLPRGLRKPLLETALEMSRYADHDTLASIEKGGALVASNLIKLVMGTQSDLSAR